MGLFLRHTGLLKGRNGKYFRGNNTPYNYGLLYNWYITQWTGDNSIISSDDWVVPTDTNWENLANSMDSVSLVELDYPFGAWLSAGIYLKEAGFTHWEFNNGDSVEGTDIYGFTARAAGNRLVGSTLITDGYEDLLWNASFMTSTSAGVDITTGVPLTYSFEIDIYAILSKGRHTAASGLSIRLCNPSTLLTEGQTGTYTGNDGKIYPTVVIGGVEWLAANLAETKTRDLTDIPEVQNDTTWAALTTGAMCAYENNWNNV